MNEKEVIAFYENLKKQSSSILHEETRRQYICKELQRYSLADWCEIGDILRREGLL